MSLLAAHMQKEKAGNLNGIQRHIDRKNVNYQNDNIDSTLSVNNYSLTKNHDIEMTLLQETKSYVNENKTTSRAIRKDAVLINAWVIGSDKEFMNNLSSEQQKQYFETAYKYFSEKFGEENVRYATVHVDEVFEGQVNPHMHLGITPLKDGKLSAKTVFNRQTLRDIQAELPLKLQQAGFAIERGIEGSESKHLNERAFRDYQEALKSEVEEPKKELKNQYLDIITDLKPDTKVSDELFIKQKDSAKKQNRMLWFIKKFGKQPEEIHTEYGRNQVSEWSSLDKLKRYAVTLIQSSMDWVRDKKEELKTRENDIEMKIKKLSSLSESQINLTADLIETYYGDMNEFIAINTSFDRPWNDVLFDNWDVDRKELVAKFIRKVNLTPEQVTELNVKREIDSKLADTVDILAPTSNSKLHEARHKYNLSGHELDGKALTNAEAIPLLIKQATTDRLRELEKAPVFNNDYGQGKRIGRGR